MKNRQELSRLRLFSFYQIETLLRVGGRDPSEKHVEGLEPVCKLIK